MHFAALYNKVATKKSFGFGRKKRSLRSLIVAASWVGFCQERADLTHVKSTISKNPRLVVQGDSLNAYFDTSPFTVRR